MKEGKTSMENQSGKNNEIQNENTELAISEKHSHILRRIAYSMLKALKTI